MVRKLSIEEINKILSLKKFAKAKRIAVENFLISSPLNLPKNYALTNLNYDIRVYNWNAPTRDAIMKGLDMMYND